ncbi:putative AT-hook motif nuclear-localized protein 20 [Iris pallida]|uniref:AT-hook motif nuclear-localized protein 20 n=1 Tax=Iris pallida TaxID=29817 RepID=A0AAX6IED3_IRIPA|nr:putative AT-hook motif nuclear-localized protein 20 [Iris pallida]
MAAGRRRPWESVVPELPSVAEEIRRQVEHGHRRRVGQPTPDARRGPDGNLPLPAAAAAAAARPLLVLLLERQPLVGRVREGRRDHHDGARRHQRPHHAPPHHLPLPAGQVDRQPGRPRRRGARQEGPRQGQYLEAAVERHGRPRGGRLPERHVGDGARAAEDADAPLAAPRELREGLGHVRAPGDLHDVAAERVGAVAGDEDGGLRLVLGSGGAAAGPAGAGLHGPLLGLVAAVVLVLLVVSGVGLGAGLLGRHVGSRGSRSPRLGPREA